MTSIELIEKALNVANQKGVFTLDDSYNIKTALNNLSAEQAKAMVVGGELSRLQEIEREMLQSREAQRMYDNMEDFKGVEIPKGLPINDRRIEDYFPEQVETSNKPI